MYKNTKNTENDAGYGAFLIGGTSFSTICKSNKAIRYLLRVEFAWGNLLTDVMGCSPFKASGIHDGMMRVAVQVGDEMLDPLEHWC